MLIFIILLAIFIYLEVQFPIGWWDRLVIYGGMVLVVELQSYFVQKYTRMKIKMEQVQRTLEFMNNYENMEKDREDNKQD